MTDPIDSDDLPTLRATILRQREQLLGAEGREEVMRDRIAELERREQDLVASVVALEHELSVTWWDKVRHRIRTLLGRPT
jgi:hypothetical protein